MTAQRLLVGSGLAALAVAWLGCAGPQAGIRSQADALLTAGDFDGAVAAWERAARDAPDDPDARAGLRRTREAWIGRALMGVRVARADGDTERATDLLLGVFAREDAWRGAPTGEAGRMQAEETTALIDAVVERVHALVAKRTLLPARALLERRKDLFSGDDGLKRYQAVGGELVAAGSQHCEQLWRAAGARTPYFAEFVATYCRYWGVGKAVGPDLVAVRRKNLVAEVSAQVQVGGLGPDEFAAVREELDAALRTTPWYDRDGAMRVDVRVTGGAVVNRSRTPFERVQRWVEQVPYAEMETYCEWRQEPVASAGTGDGRPATEYKSVCEPHQRPVSKVREVARELRYPAWKNRQTFKVSVVAEAAFDGRRLRAARTEDFAEADESSDENRPEIGLAPDPLQLTPRADWLRQQFHALAQDLGRQLGALWTTAYCVPSAEGGVDTAGEHVFQCLRAVPPEGPPAFVDAWFRQQFGVPAREAMERLGTP